MNAFSIFLIKKVIRYKLSTLKFHQNTHSHENKAVGIVTDYIANKGK